MRVLFAVSNSEDSKGDIVDVICNEYQKEYKKIISYKRVFYYDAIINGTFEGGLFENTSSGHIIGAISQLSEQMIYTSPVKIKTELFGRRVIESLLGQFMPAAVRFDTDDKMTFIDCRTIDIISGFYKSMYKAQSDGRDESEKLYLRILMVTDYISGMTDSYAKRLYNGLFV